MTPEQFNKQWSALNDIAEVVLCGDDSIHITITYGWAVDCAGKTNFGWHETISDYPAPDVYFLGATFEEAVQSLNQWLPDEDEVQEVQSGE